MLKFILFANAVSCAIFGVLFLTSAGSTATFLGDPPIWLLQVLGGGLLINATHLIYSARMESPGRLLVLYFVFGDALWVLATVGLITSGLWITTISGMATAVAVAAFVGLCGFGQWHAVSYQKLQTAT